MFVPLTVTLAWYWFSTVALTPVAPVNVTAMNPIDL